jgi:hypothetical protein
MQIFPFNYYKQKFSIDHLLAQKERGLLPQSCLAISPAVYPVINEPKLILTTLTQTINATPL